MIFIVAASSIQVRAEYQAQAKIQTKLQASQLTCAYVLHDEPILTNPKTRYSKLTLRMKQLVDEANSYRAQKLSLQAAVKLIDRTMEELEGVEFYDQLAESNDGLKQEALAMCASLKGEAQLRGELDFLKMYRLALIAAALFDGSMIAFESYVDARLLELVKEGRAKDIESARRKSAKINFHESFTQLLGSRAQPGETLVNLQKIDELVSTAKGRLAKHPQAIPFLSYDTIDELEMYQLISRKIFVLGITSRTQLVDGRFYLPSQFLGHDDVHFSSYFGFDHRDRSNAFDPSGVRSVTVSQQGENWRIFIERFAAFEQKIIESLATGQLRHIESVDSFLFEISHEIANSLAVNLQYRFNMINIADAIDRAYRKATANATSAATTAASTTSSSATANLATSNSRTMQLAAINQSIHPPSNQPSKLQTQARPSKQQIRDADLKKEVEQDIRLLSYQAKLIFKIN